MPFVTKNISEAGPAVLQAPAFLSGLSAQEAGIARGHFERTVNPQVAEAKAQALDALQHCEAGWRNATNTIRSGNGPGKNRQWWCLIRKRRAAPGFRHVPRCSAPPSSNLLCRSRVRPYAVKAVGEGFRPRLAKDCALPMASACRSRPSYSTASSGLPRQAWLGCAGSRARFSAEQGRCGHC